MEVLDSGFQVLDPGFFVGGTRFRILSLATEAVHVFRTPKPRIPNSTTQNFRIPDSQIRISFRVATMG